MKPVKQRNVHVIDATDQSLGRVASNVARILIGKHKASYVPNADVGDFVHVKNVGHIRLTGKKSAQKVYKWHTGYLGGLKEQSIKDFLGKGKDPSEIVRRAVKNMLPNNTFRPTRLRRLRVTR